ncbi:hypothetical protein BDZ89DRAFT_1128110 [Hymenopellis radicata]|nr:hypothetical protein BDZ89DRAFT_1128110 [Hymenopellis radicata]
MLLDLPLELLMKIAGFAHQKDRLNLRLTCTVLNTVAVEQAFFSLSLNTNKSLIRELSTTNIARYVKYLKVVTDTEPDNEVEFAQAIRPFVFVTGISWTCLLVDNTSFLRPIAETLASLPRVKSLKLRIGDIEIPPLPFRDLVRFDAAFTGSASAAPLSCFVDSPAVLRSLSSVSLHDMPHMDELWTLLRREEIYLSKMDVDRISGYLFDYLLAYEGLEVLKLRCRGKHRETLQELEVTPRFEGVWCFEAAPENHVFRCPTLKTLRVSFMFRSISEDLMYLLGSVQPSLEQLYIDCPPLYSPRHGPPPPDKSEGAARKCMERTIAGVEMDRIKGNRRILTVHVVPPLR